MRYLVAVASGVLVLVLAGIIGSLLTFMLLRDPVVVGGVNVRNMIGPLLGALAGTHSFRSTLKHYRKCDAEKKARRESGEPADKEA
jgi:hypothetical protein